MGVDISVSSIDTKVVVGGDARERDAVLVARDATLGLAFVHLLGEEGKPFPTVDLAAGVEPVVGRRLLAVGRKTRAYDYVPLLLRLYASKKIERPRRMWGVAGDYEPAGMGVIEGASLMGGMSFVGGTPAYDESGKPVGILSSQMGAIDESLEDLESASVLLPTGVVSKAVEAAKKLVPQALEKAAAAAAEK
jgi:hypothetical protein